MMMMMMMCVDVFVIVTEALSACHYIPEVRVNVFNILYNALNSENAELQQASHQCMKRVSTLQFHIVSTISLISITFHGWYN